jgi:predicted metal-dependent phosphoesterase TrpH
MIDLHTHTNLSDGTDTPRELINLAMAQGITTLGISDHDTTSSWEEASNALRPGMDLVLGAEISCLTENEISVHMLGLLFDSENRALQDLLEESRDQRIPRLKKMVTLLNDAGITVSIDDVHAATPAGATVGRPHLADALVALGHVSSRGEAFAELLHNDSPYYVSHIAPTPVTAIAAIKAAGGVAVIAHPFASQRGKILSAQDFAPLVAAGLNGIEVDHRDQSASERDNLRAVARELGMVITGSSDYHGNGKINRLGEHLTSPQEWEKLEAMATVRRVVRK